MKVTLQVHVGPISLSEEFTISKASWTAHSPTSWPPLHCEHREWAQKSLQAGT